MTSHRWKLCVMMFLELFIWGAWFPLASDYLSTLGFTATEKSWALNAFALASLAALFFSNQFADRNFAAEKFMAFSHLVGGLCILGLAFVTSFWPFFLLMLVHSLFYVPTLSIANAIAFAHLKDPQKEYGLVRLWGTIGWIAAAVPFVFLLVNWAKVPSLGEVGFVPWLGSALGSGFDPHSEADLLPYLESARFAFVVSGIASLLLAGFSLVLPHTPPRPAQTAEERFAWLEAIKLLAHPFLLVLFVVTFIDAMVLQGYFVYTFSFFKNQVGIPTQWIMPVMTLGQVAEIGTMAVLGLVLKRLGWRATMTLGILGHTVRFVVFAAFPQVMPVIVANLLHGVCYAFFFATVYIFVDEVFPKDARSSAQGLFNFLIFGFGPFVGNNIWPLLEDSFKTAEGVDYRKLFLVPAAVALAAALLLLLGFWPPRQVAIKKEVTHAAA